MPSKNRIHFTPSNSVYKFIDDQVKATGRTHGQVVARIVSRFIYLYGQGVVYLNNDTDDSGMDNTHGGKRVSRNSQDTNPE